MIFISNRLIYYKKQLLALAQNVKEKLSTFKQSLEPTTIPDLVSTHEDYTLNERNRHLTYLAITVLSQSDPFLLNASHFVTSLKKLVTT